MFSYLKAGSLKDLSEHTADDVLNDLWKNIETVSKHSGGSGIFFDWDRMNVLIPHDLTKLPKESDILDCCNALRLIYPSEIKIRSIINLIVQDEQYLSYGGSTTYDFYPHLRHAKPFEHYLIFYERQRKQVNQLLRLYRERVESHDYIKSAMEFYVAGWQENNPLMAFVCFCIAMEGIVSSDEQLTFRFRRNLAVLIGESAFFLK